MSNRKLAILAVVAVAMVFGAIFVSHQSKMAPSTLPERLLQGLDPADVYTVKIGVGDDAIRHTSGKTIRCGQQRRLPCGCQPVQ